MQTRIPIIPAVMAAALALCAVNGVAADDAAADERATDVATLVDQLADAQMTVRVAAERELRERGPSVLVALPDPATLSPPAADAVRRIRTHLEREQAEAILKPGRVSVRGDLTLGQALQAISEQTGNAVDVADLAEPVRSRRLTIALDHVSFWEAIGAIERQADVVATSDPQRDAVLLRARADVESPPLATTSDGPFRICVVRVGEKLDFVDPDRRLLRTVVEVLVEPRLRPLFLHVAEADIHVAGVDGSEDSAGDDDSPAASFAPLSPSARREIPIDRPGPIRVTHDVILPQGNLAPPLKAVDIRGRFELELAAGQEHFEFRHLNEAGRITRRHGGVNVTLESLTHDDEVMDLQLQLRYEADGPRFESHRSWVFHNEVWLTTGDGQSHEPADFETLAEGEGGARLRYRFTGVEGINDETQLTYMAPTLFSRVPINFSLQNVPANE